jgi:hypothetical protein
LADPTTSASQRVASVPNDGAGASFRQIDRFETRMASFGGIVNPRGYNLFP